MGTKFINSRGRSVAARWYALRFYLLTFIVVAGARFNLLCFQFSAVFFSAFVGWFAENFRPPPAKNPNTRARSLTARAHAARTSAFKAKRNHSTLFVFLTECNMNHVVLAVSFTLKAKRLIHGCLDLKSNRKWWLFIVESGFLRDNTCREWWFENGSWTLFVVHPGGRPTTRPSCHATRKMPPRKPSFIQMSQATSDHWRRSKHLQEGSHPMKKLQEGCYAITISSSRLVLLQGSGLAWLFNLLGRQF